MRRISISILKMRFLDSGMMHLANSSNTTTIGLFNVTEPEFYGVYGNKNININTCFCFYNLELALMKISGHEFRLPICY